VTALARTGKPPVPLPPLRDTHSALVDALDGGGTVGTEAGAHAFGPSDHIDRVFDIESSSPRKPLSTA
jgi:hypothetical protein